MKKVFSFLSPGDLCAVEEVWQKWQQISKDDPVWGLRFQTYFLHFLEGNPNDSKALFAAYYESEKS